MYTTKVMKMHCFATNHKSSESRHKSKAVRHFDLKAPTIFTCLTLFIAFLYENGRDLQAKKFPYFCGQTLPRSIEATATASVNILLQSTLITF